MKESLLILHLIALAAGFGSAVLLDISIVAEQFRPSIKLVHLGSKVILISLIAVWITGAGLLYLSPEKLEELRVLTKLGIVGALTLNGFIIHRWAIPMVASGAPLEPRQLVAGTVLAQISFVGWLVPLVLAVVRF